MTYEPCYADPERVAAWNAEWERRHAQRWRPIGRVGGESLYLPVSLADVPLVPSPRPMLLPESNESVRAIRALEALINAKETP